VYKNEQGLVYLSKRLNLFEALSGSLKCRVLLLTRYALIQGDLNGRNQPNAF